MSGEKIQSLGVEQRLLVMGDIHGQYEKMVKVLSLCEYDPAKDRLVLLGDYVDRGPASSRVVKAVMQLVKAGAVALYGNHEDLMLQALNKRQSGRISAAALDQWYANGGEITLNDYRADSTTLDEHLGFFCTLPRWYEEKGFLFVHAGIRPGILTAQQSPQDLIWIREPYILNYGGPQDVVTGHTPTSYIGRYDLFPDITDFTKPLIKEHKIFLDTGAAWGGPLTVMELHSKQYWQA